MARARLTLLYAGPVRVEHIINSDTYDEHALSRRAAKFCTNIAGMRRRLTLHYLSAKAAAVSREMQLCSQPGSLAYRFRPWNCSNATFTHLTYLHVPSASTKQSVTCHVRGVIGGEKQ